MQATPYRPPAHDGLSILYLSEQLVIVDKPSGLLSVPGRGEGKEDCLSRRVQAEYPDALIVHRLDMGTSGIVVMARGAESQRQLSVMFQDRRVRKRYQALVDGEAGPSFRSHFEGVNRGRMAGIRWSIAATLHTNLPSLSLTDPQSNRANRLGKSLKKNLVN